MAGKIQTSLFLEGKEEYNRGLKEIDANLRALKSEMRLTGEQFKTTQNSAEALAKKSEILSKEYEQASRKVEIYNQRLQELRDKEQSAADKVADYKAKLAAASEALEQMKNSGTATNSMISDQEKVVAEWGNKLNQANAELSQTVIKEQQTEAALNNATSEQIRYGAELDKTNGYLEEARNSTDGLAHSIDEYGKETDKAGEETEKLNEVIKKVIENAALEKLSEGAKELLENLMECAEVAEKFQGSIAKVQSIAQVSSGELGNMSDEIRRVAVEMGYSASEVAEAAYQAISASVDAGEAVGFVEDAAKLARAGFTETTTAVDVLTTALNAYGKEANTTAHIADDLITTQNLGKTTVNELAQSLGTIIPTAAAYGVSLDQLSSAYVILTKQGINTANATTYLRGMLNELGDAGSDVSDILYNLTGHSFGELTKQGYTLGDVLQLLGDSVNGNSESFANLFGNIRAGQGALAIFNQGADTFNDVLETMEHNTGAADKAFEIMGDTAEMTNAKLQASVENLKIAIGNSLTPALESIKEKGIDALGVITKFVEEHPVLVTALAGAAAALTATTVAVTGLAMAVAVAKAAFGDFKGLIALGVAGAAAATGAFGGIALSALGAADSVNDLTQAFRDQVEASKEINANTNDFLSSTRKEGAFIDDLKNKITGLNSQERLTTAQKKELRTAVNELNTLYPELNLSIDEQTGKLAENTEGWEENLDALKKREELKYIEEELAEIYRQQAENDKALYDAETDLNAIREERAEIDKELQELQQREGMLSIEENDRMETLYFRGKELNEQEQELLEIRGELQGQNEALGESEDSLIQYRESQIGAIDEETDANGELAASEEALVESNRALEEAEKAKQDAIDGASSAISKQIGLFDEWKKESELTFAEMQKRWSEQNEGIDQYTDDLSYIKNLIDSDVDPAIKDLAANMVDMGVDGAAELHEFVTGLQEIGDSAEEMQKLTDTWQEHIDKIKSAEDLYASITLQEEGYTQQSQELFNQYYAESELDQIDFHERRLEAATQFGRDLTEAANETVQSVADATLDGKDTVTGAYEEVADAAVTTTNTALGISGGSSSKFYDIGTAVTNGLANGISAGTATVASAIQSMCEQAVAAVDISGLTERIDQNLADMAERRAAASGN